MTMHHNPHPGQLREGQLREGFKEIRVPPKPRGPLTPTAASLKLTETRATCRELTALLAEENAGAKAADKAATEARLLHKKRLTLRLEALLSEARRDKTQWQNDPAAQAEAVQLEQEFRLLQEHARRNAAVLQAAHTVRAELVLAIRDAAEANAPKAQLYAANGTMANYGDQTRLLAKEV